MSYNCDPFALKWVEFQNDKYKFIHNAQHIQYSSLAVTILMSKLSNPNIYNKVQNENMW